MVGSPKPNEWPKNVSIASDDSMEGGIKEGGDESVKMVSRAARGKFPSLTLRPLLDYKGERIEYSPQASVS